MNRWPPLLEFRLVLINDTSGDVLIMHTAVFVQAGAGLEP